MTVIHLWQDGRGGLHLDNDGTVYHDIDTRGAAFLPDARLIAEGMGGEIGTHIDDDISIILDDATRLVAAYSSLCDQWEISPLLTAEQGGTLTLRVANYLLGASIRNRATADERAGMQRFTPRWQAEDDALCASAECAACGAIGGESEHYRDAEGGYHAYCICHSCGRASPF